LLLYERGYALVELGKHKDAAATYERARKIHPFEPSVLEELTACYRELGDFARMQDVLEDRLVVDPESPKLQAELGWTLAVQHRAQQALEVLQRLLARHPDYTVAYFTIGQVYADRKDPKRARASFTKFIELAERALATRNDTGVSDAQLKAYLARARTERASLE
jgi:tetratricopeptide (TPR) repeat protein